MNAAFHQIMHAAKCGQRKEWNFPAGMSSNAPGSSLAARQRRNPVGALDVAGFLHLPPRHHKTDWLEPWAGKSLSLLSHAWLQQQPGTRPQDTLRQLATYLTQTARGAAKKQRQRSTPYHMQPYASTPRIYTWEHQCSAPLLTIQIKKSRSRKSVKHIIVFCTVNSLRIQPDVLNIHNMSTNSGHHFGHQSGLYESSRRN